MLTGHRKSGTTLLHKLFDGHPEINVYPNDISLLYAFFPCWANSDISLNEKKQRITRVLKKSTSSASGLAVSERVNSFDPDCFVKIFWKHCEDNCLSKPSGLIKALSFAYCDYAELDTSLPFLFKETSQAVNFQGMIDDGLDVECIQIIRDPRDNYAAIKEGVTDYYKKMGEGERESLASLLNRASLDLHLAKDLMSSKEFNYSTLRFEDLVENPDNEMKELAKRVGISWAESLLFPTFLHRDYFGNNHGGEKLVGISAKNAGKWVERISKIEAAIIEGWMEKVMLDWGYQLTHTKEDQRRALQDFYAWYNCRYFYRDSFQASE